MNGAPRLCLHEEVMLLALSDELGKVETGTWCTQALAAAVVAELLLSGRIETRGEGKKAKVHVVDRDPSGDALVDDWLATIDADPKARTLSQWVSKASSTPKLKERVAGALVEKGILRFEEKDFLLVFKRKLYPERDPEPEREIRARLERAIFGNDAEVDARTATLIALCKSTGILDVAFGKKALKPRKERIEAIVAGNATGEAARRIVDELTTAIFISTILVPIIVT